jgi:hypothetical protein
MMLKSKHNQLTTFAEFESSAVLHTQPYFRITITAHLLILASNGAVFTTEPTAHYTYMSTPKVALEVYDCIIVDTGVSVPLYGLYNFFVDILITYILGD